MGLFHGIGAYKAFDWQYEGEWCNDKRQGLGIYQAKDGTVLYGRWYNDQLSQEMDEEQFIELYGRPFTLQVHGQ